MTVDAPYNICKPAEGEQGSEVELTINTGGNLRVFKTAIGEYKARHPVALFPASDGRGIRCDSAEV